MTDQFMRLETRITELESRENFHEYTIETLNQTIIEQQAEIEKLKKTCLLLLERLNKVQDEDPISYRIEEEIPPHY